MMVYAWLFSLTSLHANGCWIFAHIILSSIQWEKEGDLTQSYDKKPLYQQKIKKKKNNGQHKNATQKLWLRNDCGTTQDSQFE